MAEAAAAVVEPAEGWPDFIKGVRRARGLTQESLAAELLVARYTVILWEAGRAVPHRGSRRRLLDLAAAPA